MDTIIRTLKREVALDGVQGATLEGLWDYVKVARQETMEQLNLDCSDVLVDQPLKEYLWPIILRTSGLIFKINDTVVYDVSAASVTSNAQTGFARFSKLSLSQVESKYPGLIVRGTTAVINKELYNSEQGNRRVAVSSGTEKIMHGIARAKQKGVTQRDLAKNLSIDNRSMFCYVRNLESEGLITKLPIYQDGCNTNLLMLRRYQGIYTSAETANVTQHTVPASGNMGQADNEGEGTPAPRDGSQRVDVIASMAHSRLRKRLCDYMQNLEASFIVDVDLMDAMDINISDRSQRKFFQRNVSRLCEDGYIECVRVLFPDPDAKKPTSPSESKDGQKEAANEDPGSINQVPPAAEDLQNPAEDNSVDLALEHSMFPLENKWHVKEDRSTPKGYVYRRCYRFLKPYVRKDRVVAGVGIPLQQTSRDNRQIGENEPLAVADDDEAGDSDEISEFNSSSDDEAPQVDDVKERDEIKYLLTKPQARFGELACLSLDAQLFRLIALSGSHGTVTRALWVLVSSVGLKVIIRAVTRLENTLVFRPDGSIPGVCTTATQRGQNKRHLGEKLVTTVDEFIGREHRKRFFANPIAQPLIALLTADCSRITNDPILPLTQQEVGASTENPATNASEFPLADEASERTENGDARLDSNTAAPFAEQADEVAETSAAAREIMNAEYGSIKEILAEAEERKLTALSVLRERVILCGLAKESIFNCSLRQFNKIEDIVKEYIIANRGSHAIVQTIHDSVFKHTVDKSTYMRVVDKLAAQKRLWKQTAVHVIRRNARNISNVLKVIIARSVDPKGPLVDMFIQSLHDERKYHVQTAPSAPKLIDGLVDVPRTEGAEQRDCEIKIQTRARRASRAKRGAQVLNEALIESARIDGHMSKRARVANAKALWRRRPNLEVHDPHSDTDLHAAWSQIAKTLDYVPRRIGRLVDLYEYLCENLPKQVDGVYVFENCGFRTGYLFSHVPLRLFMEISSGATTIPEARHYIRYGTTPTDADMESEADNEDENVRVQGTLKEMRARLETPIKDLPPEMRNIIDRHTVRARHHIHRLISGLYILQLIRPVTSAQEITTLPAPPDMKDAFCDATIYNPRLLNFGYQLIGKARLLKEEGYLQTSKLFEQGSSKRFDLTRLYLNDEVFDLHQETGLFQYLKALELSCRVQCHKLPASHPLYGIAFSNHWHRRVLLLASQANILDGFVNKITMTTPLESLDRLKDAANQAGATLDEARRYYQQVFTKLCSVENRKKGEQKRYELKVRKKVEKAKMEEIQKKSKRSQRVTWSKDDSPLVSVFYAVNRTHAREHEHPLLLHGATDVFPSRLKTNNPHDSVRRHHSRMQDNDDYKNLCDRLNVVWIYVLRDAVTKGLLVNNPDIESFDMVAAVDYFREQLETNTLDGLIEMYEDSMCADGVRVPFGPTKYYSRKWNPNAVRPRRRTRKPASNNPNLMPKPKAKRLLPQGVPMTYLPDTMKGDEHLYIIGNATAGAKRAAPLYELTEDAYQEAVATKKTKGSSMYTMLTTHSGWSNISDYSNPVTTLLCSTPDKHAADATDDGDHSNNLESPSMAKIVARAAENMPYPDVLSTLCPINRTLDVNKITEQISQLALGNPSSSLDTGSKPDSEDQDDLNGSSSSSSKRPEYNSERWYADIASLEAIVINLTLTPDDEYDADVGQLVLEAKEHVATQAFNLFTRSQVIYQLRGMASSVGLRSTSVGSKPRPKHLTATNVDDDSTVVLHETTGITRVNAQPMASGDGMVREEATEPPGESAGQNKQDNERRVPGRGYAICSQFLNAVRPRLPSSFTHGQLTVSQHESAVLDPYLEPGAFVHLCQRIAAGKTWLRPAYASASETSFSTLAEFRRQSDFNMMHFGVRVAKDDDDMGLADQEGRSLPDKSGLESIRDSAFGTIGLPSDKLELVSSVVTETVRQMGKLGATPYELESLFAILLRDKSSGKAMSLLPERVQSVLGSREKLCALLRMLAIDKKLFVVGSGDIRYVASDPYKYWSIELDEPANMTFVPHIGQSFNGSTITRYTLGMMTSIAGHIFYNPGISQATLLRRHYAPFVPKAEVVHYLDKLIELGIVDAETVGIDSAAPSAGTANHLQPGDPGAITFYSMADGYSSRVSGLSSSFAATNIERY